MSKYVCSICGFVFDEAKGLPSDGIAPGTKFESLPDSWVCPMCGAPKSAFEKQQEPGQKSEEEPVRESISSPEDEMTELSIGQFSLLCSNLARGAEKQYLKDESELFMQLADYFRGKEGKAKKADEAGMHALLEEDIGKGYPTARKASESLHDRGALRAITWNEKVAKALSFILDRYEKEGPAFLEDNNVYVCSVCGFVYVGKEPPALCPVCKVPSWKFTQVERR